jgi:outer membrane protein TolC
MDLACFTRSRRLPIHRCLHAFSVGLVLLSGCAQFGPTTPLQPTVIRAAAYMAAADNGQQPMQGATLAGVVPAKTLPISLDTVLRLAQDQNGQINLAREKLQEAFANRDVAGKRWLPDVYVGSAYWRHEGGIQNEDGTLTNSSFGGAFAGTEIYARINVRDLAFQKIDAERKIWQQKGELSQFTSENLLDAATTYIDLLAARSGEAVAVAIQGNLEELLGRARKLANIDPGAEVEVERIESELASQQQILRKVREAAVSAAAKLVYLLGLEPCSELTLLDPQLAPLDLVDASVACCELVAQAWATGPGIQEMEGLLNLIHQSSERAKGLGQFLPVVEMCMDEGAFGAGPGDQMEWVNRWDMVVRARWNLTELASARDRKRVMQSKIQQAHWSYQDLRGKLAAGVEASREASLSGLDQVRFGRTQIEHAQKAYERSNYRLINNIQGRSPSEVLLAIRALGGAQLNYLNALRDYDKAQLRLLILLGRAGRQNESH